MRRVAVLTGTLVCILVMAVIVAPTALGEIRSDQPRRSINPCSLLTTAQAATIMGVQPSGGGFPDNAGCSWQTDPSDRANLAYVTIEVQSLTKLLGKRYSNVRTYLDKSTTVGIDPLPGVGDEGFSTYSAPSGPGTSDGLTVRVGKNVLSIGLQRTAPLPNPSPDFDQTVAIVKTIVPKLRGK